MSSSSYDTLLLESKLVMSKYSLDKLLKGFSPELLNILAQNHIDKVKQADSYEKSILLINNAISHQFGTAVSFNDFITDATDQHKLYSIFAQWRAKLLEELGIQI